MQNSFGYFCPSGAAFRGTGVSYKTVSGIFVPPKPAFGAQVCHTKQFRIFLSLRRRLSGLRACNAKQFRVFLSLRSRLSGHRCVIQNSFGYFCPSGAGFRVLRYVMQNNFKCFFSPERLSGSQVHDCKSVSGIFVPPEPAAHILPPFKKNNKYIQQKTALIRQNRGTGCIKNRR